MSVEEGFLHEVRRVELALELPADLEPREQREVVTIPLQDLTERGQVAGACPSQQLVDFGIHPAYSVSSLYLQGCGMRRNTAVAGEKFFLGAPFVYIGSGARE